MEYPDGVPVVAIGVGPPLQFASRYAALLRIGKREREALEAVERLATWETMDEMAMALGALRSFGGPAPRERSHADH